MGEAVMTPTMLPKSTWLGRKETDLMTSSLGFSELQTIHMNGSAVKAEKNVKNRTRSPKKDSLFKP